MGLYGCLREAGDHRCHREHGGHGDDPCTLGQQPRSGSLLGFREGVPVLLIHHLRSLTLRSGWFVGQPVARPRAALTTLAPALACRGWITSKGDRQPTPLWPNGLVTNRERRSLQGSCRHGGCGVLSIRWQ